jgi:PAS domain S-box-containing protein
MSADLALARTIAQETQLNLTNARYAAQQLARYSEVNSADPDVVQDLYTRLIGTQSESNPITLLSEWWVIENPEPTGLDVVPPSAFPSRDYLQQTEITRPTISNGWRSSQTREAVVTSIIPLWDELGNTVGVVISNIQLEELSKTLEKMIDEYRAGADESFQVMIVDSSRKIVAHPDLKYLLRSTFGVPPSIVTDVLRGREGNHINQEIDGQEILYSYAPVPGTGWGVIISQPTEVAFFTSQVVTQSMLIIVAVFIIVGLIFWVGLSFQVIRPLEKLAVYSESITGHIKLDKHQKKELDSLADRKDQVGHLTDTLIQMELDIEARINELATLLQTSASVVSTLESQTVLDRILEQVEKLLDVEMSAIIALERRDGTFRTQSSRGITRMHASQMIVNPDDTNSMILKALRQREPVQISDVLDLQHSDQMRTQANEVGYRSVLAIPLQTLYAPPSVLLIFRTEAHVFTNREISLLTNFANHAAMAIENAALYARSDMRLQEQTRRLESLIQSLRDGLVLENLSGEIVYANRRVRQLANIPGDEIIGAPVNDILDRLLADVNHADEIRDRLNTVPSSPEWNIIEFEMTHRGRKLNIRIQVFRVTDSFGVLIGRGLIFYDVTADKELEHMKSRLVSTVSHELRTPLASIKGYATTLLAEDVNWDLQSQREFLNIISSETDRLSGMVTDLLDLSKIEAGSLPINRTAVFLDEIIRNASRQSYPSSLGRLHLELNPDLPELFLDKRLIEVVFRNLIENAIKYASDDSPITIRANIEQRNLIVYVQDEGPGIPEQFQEQLFESFYRPEMDANKGISGFGLGLTISKGFIEAHGGQIWIEPCSTGACFAFSIPLDVE